MIPFNDKSIYSLMTVYLNLRFPLFSSYLFLAHHHFKVNGQEASELPALDPRE